MSWGAVQLTTARANETIGLTNQQSGKLSTGSRVVLFPVVNWRSRSVAKSAKNCGEERCVTTLKTAVWQTRGADALLKHPPLQILSEKFT